MTTRRRAYMLQDPYDTDAITYMNAMFTIFGLRPVCFYTDPKARYYGEQRYPILTTPAIEAAFDADLDDLADLARRVTEQYDIVTVIPYREDTLEVAAELLRHLDIDSMSPDMLARCRDKHAMKSLLTAADPPVRVPESRVVRSIDDVTVDALPDRYVIKPNDGMGSTNLGFFKQGDDPALVAAHLDRAPGQVWTLEEFIDGVEYRINGLIRHDGTVQTLAIMEYLPKKIDEHFTFAYATETQVKSTDERFFPLHEYAVSVIDALEVCGVPFHMEVKVDHRGPALIDFGARVGSEATGHLLSQLHPERPNMYAVAARDYVGPNDFSMDALDYTFYDSRTTMLVYGISETGGVVSSLRGIDEVEAMPEFVSWPVKLEVGHTVHPMSELRDVPYIAVLRHDGDRARTVELAQQLRDTIVWNDVVGPVGRLAATWSNKVPRAVTKLKWVTHRLGKTMRSLLGADDEPAGGRQVAVRRVRR